MSNEEKISAYLEGEMSEADKLQFEAAINNDAELQREVNLQQDIIDGIKEARRLEIKAMLDKVPVGGSTIGGSLTLGKVVSGIAIVGMVALGVYYLAPQKETISTNPTAKTEETLKEEPATPVVEEENTTQPQQQLAKEEVVPQKQEAKKQPTSNTEEITPVANKPVEINKPSEAPMFETGNSDSLEAPTNEIVSKVENDVTSLDVEIDNTRKKYSFHYQFNHGKLFLYGEFDKGLYEILEFKTTTNKMLFLYYKDEFYPLDKQQNKITALKPVKEPSLLKKLEGVAGTHKE